MVIAKRDIEEGEELCAAYVEVDEEVELEQRRWALQKWGFRCACERCHQEEGAAQKYEENLAEKDFQEKLK
jgi:SET domain-containing protein